MWPRPFLLAAAAILLSPAFGQSVDPLVAGFEQPPSSAKPRVWWHWINGNVSEEGIRLDLAWLKQVGVGGVHNFDASLAGNDAGPWIADRVAYLTPRWSELFRFAVTQAQQNGMEFTIAASPGWSESGGPWVRPPQGMKKFVWSETFVQGGKRFTGKLAQPPRVTGPFQNVAVAAVPFATQENAPEYYADAAVVAYRAPVAEVRDRNNRPNITSSAGPIDASLLSDGDMTRAVELPFGDAKVSWIQFSYAQPTRIQSLTVAVSRPSGGAPSDSATGGAIWLESSPDGSNFSRVIEIPRDGAPQQTLSFAPVTARLFRLVLERPTPQPSILELLGQPPAPKPTAHQVGELVLHTAARINRFEDKAGFTARAIAATEDTRAIDTGEAMAHQDIVDLTGKLRPDGTLDWTPPTGNWVVLRFGYSLTGRTNHPASAEGTGLEVDKLNKEHVKAYFDAYMAAYVRALGPQLIGKQGLQNMLTDSYEAGIANWTDDILEQFAKRRGYDPRHWLPALAGRVVLNSAASDRFLWDFRKTLGDLIADAHYGYLSSLLREKGMGRYGESHESGRAFIGDGMEVKKSATVPMGAIWASAPWPHEFSNDADIRESASVAHIYGQNLVAAESLTAFGNTFAFTPETLKPHADRAMAMGLNRFVIHTSVHQPDDRLGPGVTLGPFGQWFTRHETWAGQAASWIDYLSRSDFLLQQGQFVADVAYLYGEDNNVTNLFGASAPAIPNGYNFDFINSDAIINVVTVKDGALSAPSGMRYRVLALDPSTRRMSLPLLRKIRDLVTAGAVVVGARPEMTPSYADDPAEFAAIVNQLWSPGANQGAQRSVHTGELAATLMQVSVPPDFLVTGDTGKGTVRFVHRALPDGDVYFVSSDSTGPRHIEASFRVSGKAPEIWRADSGTRTFSAYRTEAGRTTVPLELQAHDAVFVVFRKLTSEASLVVPEKVREPLATLTGPWAVAFPANLGAPATARFPELASWTDNPDPGIKYFSGTASYTQEFVVQSQWLSGGSRIQLDLGAVRDIAEVSVNGHPLGVLWKTPFVVDITDSVHAGRNSLEIRVTNVWPNRIIGDKQPGALRIAYSTFDAYTKDSPLLPSGLLGPVRLERLRDR